MSNRTLHTKKLFRGAYPLTERARVQGVNGTRVISAANCLWQFQRCSGKSGRYQNAGPATDKATALHEMGPAVPELRPAPSAEQADE